jgi:hypothetical protein
MSYKEFAVYRRGTATVIESWTVLASSEEEALDTYKTKGVKDPSIEVDYDDYETFAEEVG